MTYVTKSKLIFYTIYLELISNSQCSRILLIMLQCLLYIMIYDCLQTTLCGKIIQMLLNASPLYKSVILLFPHFSKEKYA